MFGRVVLTIIITIDILLCHGKIMVWIQHPEVENYFKYLRNQNDARSPLKNLRKSDKNQLCLSSLSLFSPAVEDNHPMSNQIINELQDISITSPYQKSKMLYRILYPYNFDVNERYCYVDNLIDRTTDYLKIPLKIEDEIITVDALPCIVHQQHTWYIINGYLDNVYFTAESNVEEHTILTGLMEPLPQPHFYNGDMKKLEVEFLKGQLWSLKTQKRTSLCKLDTFHRFRLCSIVYILWRSQQYVVQKRWYILQNVYEHTCLTISSIYGLPKIMNQPMVPVDVIPCGAVDQTMSDPEFYLTADETDPHSVFIITTKKKKRGKTKFFLSMHVGHIRVLTNENLDLMIDTPHNNASLDTLLKTFQLDDSDHYLKKNV